MSCTVPYETPADRTAQSAAVPTTRAATRGAEDRRVDGGGGGGNGERAVALLDRGRCRPLRALHQGKETSSSSNVMRASCTGVAEATLKLAEAGLQDGRNTGSDAGATMRPCACWWSTTRCAWPRRCNGGCEAEGFTVDVAHDGLDGLWHATEHTLRRDRARHHAARHERLPGVRRAAPARRGHADPHAHRQGRRVRRGRGARHRRRRLPVEAVLVRGAGGAAAGAGAPHPRPVQQRRGGRPGAAEPGQPALHGG